MVVDDELLTLEEELLPPDDELFKVTEVERIGAEIALLVSLVVVGRAGNAEVEVLRRCVLVEVEALREVDVPRAVDVDTLLSLARRTAAEVDVVATLLDEATLAAMRDELLKLRRSFSSPLL